MNVLGVIVAVLFFIAGIAGTILPALPGAPLIVAGMLVYGLIAGFGNLTLGFFIGQILAVLLILLIDYAANVWGVKRFGGSRRAVWGSLIGLVLGVIFLGPVGIIFGPFVGTVAGELIAQKPLTEAVKSGMGAIIGYIGGMAFKFVVEAGMIIWFFATIY